MLHSERLLDDVLILDTTQLLAGPFATSQLGDLGAEVIKIEHPDGELSRRIDPAMDDLSAYFVALNRNKRYLTLDLKSRQGQQAFRDLAAEADVVIENFKAGTMNSFDLGYSDLTEVNPELIYCSMKPFGEDSPYEDLPALDFTIQAMSGAMSITGPSDHPPVRTGVPIGDIASGMYATQAIIAALYRRDTEGGGQHLEVSLLDSLISWVGVRAAISFVTGQPYPRGNEHSNFAPWTLFETQDAHVVVAINSNFLWPKFCSAIDREDIIDDERFETNRARLDHADELYAILEEEFKTKQTKEWFQIAREYEIPLSPVYDTVTMWDDPHIKNSDLRTTDTTDSYDLLRHPVRFDGERLPIRQSPEQAGADTESILHEFGFSDEEILELSQENAI